MLKSLSKLLIVVFSLLIFTSITLPSDSSSAFAPISAPGTPEPADVELIESAILQAIAQEKTDSLALLLYDTRVEKILISTDGQMATAWLVPVDPQTGYDIPAEPGLAIAVKTQGYWQAVLPSNSQWIDLLRQVPEGLVTEDAMLNLIDFAIEAKELASTTYTGYKLPWAAGETLVLTQSTRHDYYTPSGNAHYAFDFAKPGYPSGMFNVHAVKGGTVKKAVWTYPNGSESGTNLLLIEDTTTEPTTFQLYLHFAQDSIPPELRVVGAPVLQGQYIGLADDTGVSSGNHLHFMVHAYVDYWWGPSVDITFSDVAINGGRPRIIADLPYCYTTDVCDTTQTYYVSGNTTSSDTTPPSGSITTPTLAATVNTSIIRLEGWASDTGSGLASAQFKANYNGSWQLIGSPFTTTTFALDWDMCAASVPDGPVSLALELRDLAGNLSGYLTGLVHFTKNYACPKPPPLCSPSSDQVALFAEPDFQGYCVTLNTGSYTSDSALGVLGGNNAESMRVGSNVKATLFSEISLLGRGETFLAPDSNLSDNLITANSVSSVLVQALLATPSVPRLVFPANGAIYTTESSFSFSWENAGGASQFQARLLVNSVEVQNSGWLNNPRWHFGYLAAGNYTWQVKARNAAGESSWSATRSLTIQAASLPGTPVLTTPFLDTMETLATDWSHSNYWDLTETLNHTPSGRVSWTYDTNSISGYDTGSPNSGYLTTPPVLLPAIEESYLRFWYFYETETPGVHWDQRWIQISVDDGPFINLHQLSDDEVNIWLQSPAISLQDYSGSTIRVRFYFTTLDGALNQYQGWFIDDVSINNTAPTECLDLDNTSLTATEITYGANQFALICPGGDLDFYKFQGSAGDHVGIRLHAQDIGSGLDTHLSLLAEDGASLLIENDDLVSKTLTDSAVTYTLARNGTYYIKVRAWNHPTTGGISSFYTLQLVNDNQDPSAAFTYPVSGQSIPLGVFNLVVSASDSQSGISHVDFYWHSTDWQNTDWMSVGQDWQGSNGWSIPFDLADAVNPSGIAFYAKVYDLAGNWIGQGVYNIQLPGVFLPLVIHDS